MSRIPAPVIGPDVFELVRLKSGVMSLRALANGETFHPVTGPEVEARVLHVEQQRLLERAREHERFVIWDVGLGAGANALAAVHALRDVRQPVEIHSFDQTSAPLDFAIKHADTLGYLRGYELILRQLMSQGRVEPSPFLRWFFHCGDFSKDLDLLSIEAPHAILYDPYSSGSNPEMWTLEHFRNLFSKLSPERPCLLTNYTRSTAVRVSLLLAGFFVGIGEPVGEKGETTTAANHLSLVRNPLDRRWLDRVKTSRNSAPLRVSAGRARGDESIGPEDHARLKTLPQFA